MKKTILLCVLLAAAVLLGTVGVSAQEKITDFRSTIHVNTNGTIDVEEKIVYDFGDIQHHGIYREIPYILKNPDGKRYNIDMHVFSVTDEIGDSYRFEQSNNGSNLRIKIGDANRYVTGVHTYMIRYRASGALRYFSDHDELYWNLTGNDWPVEMADAQGAVILPSIINGDQLKIACYTGTLGSTANDCKFNTDQNAVYYSANHVFSPGEGMTIVVGFPKGIVSVLEPKPVFYDTPFGIFLKRVGQALLLLAILGWYILFPVYIIIQWFKHGRDPKGDVGEVRAGFDPPKRPDGTPLSPAETGALLDEVVDQRDISALLVDLARRGYLRIEERKKKDFYFVKTVSKDKRALENFEQELLDGIFEDNTEVGLNDLKYQLSDTVSAIKKDLYAKLVSDGFFPKNPETTRTIYTVVAVLGIVTGNILLFLTAIIFGRNMPQKTVLGANERNVAKSLKNFLSSQERQLEFQAKNQMMFEKLLPYAIAFGVEKIWAERFKDIDLKQPSWYSGYNSSVRFNSVYLTNSISNTYGGLSAASQNVSSTGSSSGFGGGGFSGGGGGGGGGGSW